MPAKFSPNLDGSMVSCLCPVPCAASVVILPGQEKGCQSVRESLAKDTYVHEFLRLAQTGKHAAQSDIGSVGKRGLDLLEFEHMIIH